MALWESEEEEHNEQLATKGESQSVRVAKESGWYADLKENFRSIAGGISGFMILLVAIIQGWTWLGLFVVAYLVSAGFHYFFWQNQLSPPVTGVVEVDNAKRVIGLTMIPDPLIGEFNIEGVKQFYYDNFGTPLLIADEFDLEDRFIKCAYSHNVSNLELAVSQEALNDAKENALEILRENAELKENMDLKVERRLKGAEDTIRDQIEKDLSKTPEDQELTEQEAREIVNQ